MRTKIVLITILVLLHQITHSQVAVNASGTLPDSHAMLDVSSNSKGVLVPRMTTGERDAIASPPNGLLIYNTSSVSFQYYNGVSWINITHSGLITGTLNKVPRFTGPLGLQNGLMTDNGIGVSLNTTNAIANPSAIWDVSSNNKGILLPRMTSTERNAIASPAKGLLVFDSTLNSFLYHDGASWSNFSTGSGSWLSTGSHIYNANTGNVGINTNAPLMRMHITDTSDRVLLLENTSNINFATKRSTGIYFGNNIGNVSNLAQYNGAIKSIVNNNSNAHIGFFTQVHGTPQTLLERMVITDYGFVGINNDQPNYELDVNGDIKSNNATFLQNVTAITNLTSLGSLNIQGTANWAGAGLVISNTSATQKIIRTQASFTINGLAPNGFLISGTLNYGPFSDIPTVTMGAVSNGNGNWYQISVVPASVTNSGCVFIFSNNSSVPVAFSNVVWQIMIIGNK